jgi:hypothetical protein
MFTVWFATGTVLLFVPFPALPEMDRVVRSQQIDFGGIKIPPATIADRIAVGELMLGFITGYIRLASHFLPIIRSCAGL